MYKRQVLEQSVIEFEEGRELSLEKATKALTLLGYEPVSYTHLFPVHPQHCLMSFLLDIQYILYDLVFYLTL